MARRIVIAIEKLCDHNEVRRHGMCRCPDQYGGNAHPHDCPTPHCPGGSRRVLDPGSYVLIEKVDGVWEDADELLRQYGEWLNGDRTITMGEVISMERTLDALAGGEQP